jgi:hypothetical protein
MISFRKLLVWRKKVSCDRRRLRTAPGQRSGKQLSPCPSGANQAAASRDAKRHAVMATIDDLRNREVTPHTASTNGLNAWRGALDRSSSSHAANQVSQTCRERTDEMFHRLKAEADSLGRSPMTCRGCLHIALAAYDLIPHPRFWPPLG